jgi:hypothetical protein
VPWIGNPITGLQLVPFLADVSVFACETIPSSDPDLFGVFRLRIRSSLLSTCLQLAIPFFARSIARDTDSINPASRALACHRD